MPSFDFKNKINGLNCLILIFLAICGVLYGYAFVDYKIGSDGFYICFLIGSVLLLVTMWAIKLRIVLGSDHTDRTSSYSLLSDSGV